MIFPFPFFTAPEILRFASDAAFFVAQLFERAGQGFEQGAVIVGGWPEMEDNQP